MDDKLKTINPQEPADFTPEMGNYKPLKPFRFWCQKVLPTIYSDSLSYYELLEKVVNYLNETMGDVEVLNSDVEGLLNAYIALQGYVNNYFSSLDVQQEIDNKLDEMTLNGTLSNILSPIIMATMPPLVVESVNNMSDKNRTYILKSNGHVYQFINGNWTDTNFSWGNQLENTFTYYGALNSQYSDLNNVIGNGYWFISSPNTINNTPETGALWFIQYYDSNELIYQWCYKFNNSYYYTRYKFGENWSAWKNSNEIITENSLNLNPIRNIVSLTGLENSEGKYNLNDLPTNNIYFMSVGGGSNPQYLNAPKYNDTIKAGTIITIKATDNISLQIFYPYDYAYSPMIRNQKNIGNWSEWCTLSIKQQTIRNLYDTNITIDLNNINFPCNLLIDDAYNSINTPYGNIKNAYYIKTEQFDSILIQTYKNINGDIIYSRRCFLNENWSEWKQLQALSPNGIFNIISMQGLEDENNIININNLPSNNIYFLSIGGSSNPQYSNAPEYNGNITAGTIFTLRSSEGIAVQIFYPYDFAYSPVYRSQKTTGWGKWIDIGIKKQSIREVYNNPVTLDLNTFFNYPCDFIIDDGFTSSNTPWGTVKRAYFFKTEKYDNILKQTIRTFSSGEMYTRTSFIGGNWGGWNVIAGGDNITKNITENTYNINYTITTNPQINNIDNYLLQPLDTESTPLNQRHDMTGVIQTLLNNTGVCRLGTGIFYVSGNISIPSLGLVCGQGNETKIILLENSDDTFIFRMKRNCTIKDVLLSGGENTPIYETPTERCGIYLVDSKTGFNQTGNYYTAANLINAVYFQNFTGSGIYSSGIGGGVAQGAKVSDCYFENCSVGINLHFFTEYWNFSNCQIIGCYTSCINNGGNNKFVNCTFQGNIGFIINDETADIINEAHGQCVDCTFNHIGGNTGDAIIINTTTNGFIFSSCQIFYGNIKLKNAKGILFSNILLNGKENVVIINNCTTIIFNNVLMNDKPTFTINGGTNIKFIDCYEWQTGNVFNPNN